MKYSLVLAALSAAAIATPYVNVEVSEESLSDGSNHGINHHRGRHHEHRHGGWWAGLWSGRDRNGRSRSNGRRSDNNRRDRSRDRSRNRSRNGGRRDRSRSRDRFDAANLLDDIISNHYECVLNGRTNKDERRDTERCCNENGGELYDQQGHCIFRDVLRDPRDDWRDCAMKQRGAEFAECYYREAREIEDELDGRGEQKRDRNSRSSSRDRNNRDSRDNSRDRNRNHRNRNHRNHRNGRNDRNRMEEQTVLGGDRRRERYECRVDMDQDMNRAEEIARECCEEEVEGRFDQFDRTCQVDSHEDREHFMECANSRGAQDSECRRRQ